MNEILNLHISQHSKTEKNEFLYKENIDEHFAQGSLVGVEVGEGGILARKPIFHLIGDKIEDASDSRLGIVNHNVTIVQDPETGVDCINLMGGYLSIPMDYPIVSSSDDFTIEWWERAMGTIGSGGIFQTDSDVAVGYETRGILMGHTGKSVYMATEGSSSWNIANGVAHKTYTANLWEHWAYVKKGNIYTTYRNGVKYHSATYTAKFGAVNGFSIGAWLSKTTRDCNYNALIRQYKIWDYAKYTDNFSVNVSEAFKNEMRRVSPTIEFPDTMSSARVNWEGEGKVEVLHNKENTVHTKLLLHGDEIADASMYNVQLYKTNAINIVEGKFNKAFELGTGYVRFAINHVDFSGLSDFTVDWWEFCQPGVGSGSSIFSTKGTSKGLMFGHHDSNTEGSNIYLYMSTDRHAWKVDKFVMGRKTTNTWIHRAVCWSAKDKTFYAFQDGKLYGTKEVTLNEGERFECALDYVTILKAWSGTSVGSKVSEFRITDRCEWTKDFVPAVRPYDINQDVVVCEKNDIIQIPKDAVNTQVRQTLENTSQTISNFSLSGVYSPRREIIRPKDIKSDKEVWLYRIGEEFEEVTGGWLPVLWDINHNYGHTLKTDAYLEFGDNNGSNSGFGGFVQNYGIDLTPYSTLYVDIEQTTYYTYNSGTAHLIVCLCRDNRPNHNAITYSEVYVRTNSNGRITLEIDISKYNGIYHVGVFARNQGYNNNTCVGRLHEVKLIK